MKTLDPLLVARLSSWVVAPFPVHRFVRLEQGGSAGWRRWTDYPSDIMAVDGHDYLAGSGLVDVGYAAVTTQIDRQGFSFSAFDDDGGLEALAASGAYRGLRLVCDIHFASAPAEIRSLTYRDVHYDGFLDGISVHRDSSGKFVATLTGVSPFAPLDQMRGRMGSREDQRTITATDSSMDEAISTRQESDLKWGQRV